MLLNEFIKISPGFRAAVNLEMELHNLDKVAGFIPTEVSREIILDLARKMHPTASDQRSRLIMGTYGTGKSHLALVLANLYQLPIETPQLQTVVDKLDADTRNVLLHTRRQIAKKYLIVTLYGDVGRISDAFSMGLRIALNKAGLEHLLSESAYDAANKRIEEVAEFYPESYEILKQQASNRGQTISELSGRLRSYDRDAFELFCEIHPSFSGGHRFIYSSMIDPGTFYNSVCKELVASYDYSGIVVFWDEFGQKMEEVVKDPRGREGEDLQKFAECCNYSEEQQIHLYLFCHRSLKEYTSRVTARDDQRQRWEADLRKIEGRFKSFILRSSDSETFHLIDSVIINDEQSPGWQQLRANYSPFFESLTRDTEQLNYFLGFSRDELEKVIIYGTYPLHPMAVYSLPAISEKVAQNNRTLFTCLCEDEVGSFCRFTHKVNCSFTEPAPPFYTVDMLWDYFANDVRQQEQTYAIFRDYEHLLAKLNGGDDMGKRILKAVSVFRVTNPTRFKITQELLAYSLNIAEGDLQTFYHKLDLLSDLRDENRVLMRLNDGSYRTAVSGGTESLMVKIRKLLDLPITESPLIPAVKYFNSIWEQLPVPTSYEATAYSDEYGVVRELSVQPISVYQLKESLHLLTKNLGKGTFQDGQLLVVISESTDQIEQARSAALGELASEEYQQVLLAIPKQPVSFLEDLLQHQALQYLKKTEPNLYAESGELHEEWKVWYDDINDKVTSEVQALFNPENHALDYYWKGELRADVANKRKLKSLVSEVMSKVFPFSPMIGDDKLARDDFAGNWGYRKDCRDITLKLAKRDAPRELMTETGAAQKHVIQLLLVANGILYSNQAGEPCVGRPAEDKHIGAMKVWDAIAEHIEKAKRGPQEMKTLVTKLRKPPYGLKCRVMPIFFAAVAHNDLVLGNISFEFQRTTTRIEKIPSFDHETLEKIFTNPEKYKLVYVNVSSDQKELLEGLAKAFAIDLNGIVQPLERVRRVGEAIATWWRALPRHAQLTQDVSDETAVFRDYVLKPLAAVEANVEKILLHDVFTHVFDVKGESVKRSKVQQVVEPIRLELEQATERLRSKVQAVFSSVFENPDQQTDPAAGIRQWFEHLPDEKQNYTFSGDAAVLIRKCREAEQIDESALRSIAELITGMSMDSWADDLVLIFKGRLHSARASVDSYAPIVLPEPPGSLVTATETDADPDKVRLSLYADGRTYQRILDSDGDVGQNGQVMENMLNAAVDNIGRSLDEQEKMLVLYKFIRKYVFGESI